jgi:PAS domain S-box-containing protein
LAIIVIALVVGEIRNLSDKLRDNEDNARQLADVSFEALVIHDKGIILEVNQSFCRMYGVERLEVIGMSALQFTAPEDRELVRQKIASGDTRPYEGFALRKDGTSFRAQVMGKPITYKGRIVRVTAIRDITESLETRDALEVERILLRTLIANLPHRIFYKDTQGCYVVINNVMARTYSLNSVDDAVGKSVFDFYPKELAAKYHADDMAVVQSGEPLINREETSINENGKKIWLLTNKLPVRDRDGQVIGLIGISIDITDRKQAEAQRLELALAQEKAEFLKEFLNTVSHDLKTPLSIMNTTVYLLERLTDPETQKNKLEIIKGQTLRLTKLIEDILMMSQLESVPELDLQPLDINLLLGNIGSGFRAVAEQKPLTMNLSLTPTLPRVLGDEDSINRVFVNLIENALSYTPAEGIITIQTFVHANNVTIEIRDTGIGVSETDLPYIFDPFFRADRARAAHTGGTGLGLAIVKKIIEMHGGSIEVESQPGVGSTFRVRLPILEDNLAL